MSSDGRCGAGHCGAVQCDVMLRLPSRKEVSGGACKARAWHERTVLCAREHEASYLGCGGVGLTVPVVSYAPRPMLLDSGSLRIMLLMGS